ncbi:MAG: hypothetical protein Q9165_008744 [Trypethelium subeluteriae]
MVDTPTGGEDGDTTQPPGADSSPTDSSSPYVADTTSSGTLARTSIIPGHGLVDDSETCLIRFRDKMLPSFPFTYIARDVTVQQLQQHRPFFLRAIIAVASPSKQQKLAYGKEFKHILAQMTLVQNLSSIDLLQGLLVFTAWSYDQVFHPSGTLSRLVSLATSLACELRLDKPLPSDEHMMKPMIDDPRGQEYCSSEGWFVAEEQKAVLACYALSSTISIYFAQIDAMKWKPRMDESLRAIEANTDCPADAALACQIRLQLLAQKSVQIREHREWDSARSASDLGPALSANLYIRTLQGQLHQLGESLPETIRQRATLIMHMHYIELCLSEAARTSYLHAAQGPRSSAGGSENNDDTSTSGGNMLGFDFLDFSWRSVNAIKSWMGVFFSLPPAECAGLSFMHMAQLARCLVVLYRLSTFDHPAWDCVLVRNTMDLMSALDGVTNRLELASREVGERSPDDLFMHVSGMVRKFRSNAAAKMAQKATAIDETGWMESGEVAGAGVAEAAAIQNSTLLQPMGPGDDAFLESIFGHFEAGWAV